MGRDPVELVRELFAGTVGERSEDLRALLADDIVINGSGGEVFVGHEGFTQWYGQQRASGQLGLEDRRFEDLGNGWVLVGAEDGSPKRAEDGSGSGCWLARVRCEKVSATLYYATRNEARKALRI